MIEDGEGRDEADDQLAALLRGLPTAPLDEAVATRVLARAKAYLEPAEGAAGVRLVMVRALVPGLLATAAVDHVAETMKVVDTIYGHAPGAAGGARPRRK